MSKHNPRTSEIQSGGGTSGTAPAGAGVEALPAVGPQAEDDVPTKVQSHGVESLTAVGLPADGVRKGSGGISAGDLDKLGSSNELEAIKANLAAGHYAKAPPGSLATDLRALSFDDVAVAAQRDQLAERASEK